MEEIDENIVIDTGAGEDTKLFLAAIRSESLTLNFGKGKNLR